ncbi:MAG: hypothetical protein QOF33_4641 [Thermomicrobiales bacterium]|jgi:hypothetical protein|nr:hypothetical protein [Thermomicrobiales bacterium]
MSDPTIDREEAANQAREGQEDDARRDGGILGTVERALSFVREREDEPESAEEIEGRRRANDEEQRAQ